MTEHCLYFPTKLLKAAVQQCGGAWNDKKERPLVCLVKSRENTNIYWAIPMGDMSHRTPDQVARINSFLSLPPRDIRSCYYHVANTDKVSLFFISDVIPITDKYIERDYLVNNSIYEIKNQHTLLELQRKLQRILAVEARKPNCFRQHITAVKQFLLSELNS